MTSAWKAALVLLLGVAIGLAASTLGRHFWMRDTVRFDTSYQAVLLDTGQVYYGKLERLNSAFPVLTDVFYVQNKADAQTKVVSNILVRRGKEWHAPDRMVLNARHIVLIEPVGPDSQVSKLIQALKEQ
jgi:hypothetical protein